MKNFLTLLLSVFLASASFCQENPLWMRYSAISPDGQTILFSYKGDIWSVPSAGGTAVPLTLTESYEYAPVWSHDGKMIAFASDRNGNFDVFVMPASGGEAKRLTYSSNKEVPCCFTANNKDVMFSAYRQDLASNAQFPLGGLFSEVYTVPVAGGKVSMLLPTPALAFLAGTGSFAAGIMVSRRARKRRASTGVAPPEEMAMASGARSTMEGMMKLEAIRTVFGPGTAAGLAH